jgi:hypothetical protein
MSAKDRKLLLNAKWYVIILSTMLTFICHHSVLKFASPVKLYSNYLCCYILYCTEG